MKEKIRQSLTGRKHSELAVERMRIKRRARPPRTPEQLQKEAYRDTVRRRNAFNEKRFDQWHEDQRRAWKRPALFLDVKQSGGWACKRKLHDPTGAVSDGMTGDGELVWFTRPWGLTRSARSRAWWQRHYEQLIKEN